MAETTEITWCDSTFNPWIGCAKVSPGCDHCYAEREFDHRHRRAKWGVGQERSRTSVHNWKFPLRWNRKPFYECLKCGQRGELRARDQIDVSLLICPTCGVQVQPARRRVFCASLADVFDNEVPAQWRTDLFALIEQTPNVDWLILTKRIGNAGKMIRDARLALVGSTRLIVPEVLPNVWIGATIVNQAEADRDIPKLLATPAAVRFVSIEPLLGPVRLNLATTCDRQCSEFQNAECPGSRGLCAMQNALDWVIVGGESGPKARPMHPNWVRTLRDQCADAGTPFLFKQWGEFATEYRSGRDINFCYDHSTTGGWIEITGIYSLGDGAVPLDPMTAEHIFRLGKKAAGRLLDGIEHNGYPEVQHV